LITGMIGSKVALITDTLTGGVSSIRKRNIAGGLLRRSGDSP
jgi:hypothetical protein